MICHILTLFLFFITVLNNTQKIINIYIKCGHVSVIICSILYKAVEEKNTLINYWCIVPILVFKNVFTWSRDVPYALHSKYEDPVCSPNTFNSHWRPFGDIPFVHLQFPDSISQLVIRLRSSEALSLCSTSTPLLGW